MNIEQNDVDQNGYRIEAQGYAKRLLEALGTLAQAGQTGGGEVERVAESYFQEAMDQARLEMLMDADRAVRAQGAVPGYWGRLFIQLEARHRLGGGGRS